MAGAQKVPIWITWRPGNDCRCNSGKVLVGLDAACVGRTGFEEYFNSNTLQGKQCRCEQKQSQVGQGDDGNPWDWDRYRRCDDSGYAPPCRLCEGIGGLVDSDDQKKVSLPFCEVVASKDDIQASSVKAPVWDSDFTVFSYEILIGAKQDPACFQSFPSNESTGPNCYKPQEVTISSDMIKAKALRLDVNQGGNAWGVVGNITSVILHQYGNMWIMNQLPLGVTQTICAAPREGFDPSKPAVAPLQFNWTNNLRFMGREKLDVEYGVGMRTLDHWIFGPHHVWTAPETGMIVRMWQPWNGLQVFSDRAFQQGTDPSLFAELSPDGSRSPAMAKKGGSTFRIKCSDDGFNNEDEEQPSFVAQQAGHQQAGHRQSSVKDLHRARTKVPGAAYKGHDFGSMSGTLNKWLMRHAPASTECDAWTVEELQGLQIKLFALRDSQLDDVYQGVADNRRLRSNLTEVMKEWEELNSLARQSAELTRIHRDGHCHEAVMWYVHHLPEVIKTDLMDRIALPLLAHMQHDLDEAPATKVSLAASRVHKAYKTKVSCASCHTAVFPE